MKTISISRPEMLWLLLLVPGVALLLWRDSRRRAARWRLLGNEALLNPSRPRFANRLRVNLLLLAGLLLAVVASCGPCWGTVPESGVTRGRDIVVVLDFSRSMLADDMTDSTCRLRWQAAREGVKRLAEALQTQGGHRMGLVLFAAKPWIACPLTTDIDHFLLILGEYSPASPPPEIIPAKGQEFPSGTRIGSALRVGVSLCDPNFPGYQNLLLVSDGHDPSEDRMEEIQGGIRAAIDAKVPVYTVGVGNPDTDTILELGDELISTRLEADVLKDISRQTSRDDPRQPADEHFDTRTVPPLDEWFRTKIEPKPLRDLPEEFYPQPRERSGWFLLAAMLLLALAWRLEG